MTRAKLTKAARAYQEAPKKLRTAILEAADAGDKPADITRAIDHAYTTDYVARLIREHRKSQDS